MRYQSNRTRFLAAMFATTLSTTMLFCGCQERVSSDSLASGLYPTVGPSTRGYQLYQANCAACHGSNGRGDGRATIALDIRPRDFWNEPLRYISTLDGVPTHEDVVQTVRSGRTHGEMPAGPFLNDRDTAALADFVVELRRAAIIEDLERELEDNKRVSPEMIQRISYERVLSSNPIVVAAPSAGFQSDLTVGKSLYFDQCASCHGATGRGDGLDLPLDEQGRVIAVRDLTSGEFRGGDEPIELFKRIRCGIPGTPMPKNIALSDDEVWQLVHYSYFLAGRRLGDLF